MRSWVVEELTEAGQMAWAERPDPVPEPGGYVIRVEAAGVNFADTLMMRGRYQRKPDLPFVPGIEVAGTIVSAESGAALPIGARVCASLSTGGFAELAAVSGAAATPIPNDVPADVALVPPRVNYPTSWYALHNRARIRAGETVLVHAGAGGVGSAAIQIAVIEGCRVIATAGSDDKLLLKEGAALGVYWGEAKKRNPALAAEVRDALLDRYRAGCLDPLIGGRFPLSQAGTAVAELAARRTVGKILLTPDPLGH